MFSFLQKNKLKPLNRTSKKILARRSPLNHDLLTESCDDVFTVGDTNYLSLSYDERLKVTEERYRLFIENNLTGC